MFSSSVLLLSVLMICRSVRRLLRRGSPWRARTLGRRRRRRERGAGAGTSAGSCCLCFGRRCPFAAPPRQQQQKKVEESKKEKVEEPNSVSASSHLLPALLTGERPHWLVFEAARVPLDAQIPRRSPAKEEASPFARLQPLKLSLFFHADAERKKKAMLTARFLSRSLLLLHPKQPPCPPRK